MSSQNVISQFFARNAAFIFVAVFSFLKQLFFFNFEVEV